MSASTTPSTQSTKTEVVSALNDVIEFPSLLETPYLIINGRRVDLGPDTLEGSGNGQGMPRWLRDSAIMLRQNHAIAIPTETVYGLAANALSSESIKKIFAAKNRPSDNPLIVHVSSLTMLRDLYRLSPQSSLPFLGVGSADPSDVEAVEREMIPEVYHKLIDKAWPGPLTIVLPRPPCIPMDVLGGHGTTVAFRFPSHPIARAIIATVGLPLAAPSANVSGKPSPTLASHVLSDLDGRIPLIVDGGQCDVGLESTVIDAITPSQLSADGQVIPCVLRPGGIIIERLRRLGGIWGEVKVYKKDFVSKQMEDMPSTPGMKYRHYSPNAVVTLFVPTSPASLSDEASPQVSFIAAKMYEEYKTFVGPATSSEGAPAADRRLGVIATNPTIDALKARIDEDPIRPSSTVCYRPVASVTELAREMFRYMREMDHLGAAAIFIEGVTDDNDGLAVMNRLDKASTHQILC
ncbi:hypothetical protein EV182_001717 [Spiromyces aspiralis]|uniref:Uncharacterized protein n=1 Tax=Spiromyces aspiralis TaxID=68401 RepID=A0ACC1HT23_9FUNG|nr:hypothetical protein EV182_001717 [Spiromyces aspiralis]